MSIIVDGKKMAEEILAQVREDVLTLKKKFTMSKVEWPHLVAVIVGNDPASLSYLKAKQKKCEEVGIGYTLYQFEEKITTTKLRAKMRDIRKKHKGASIIIELPLPKHINTQYILDSVPPEEDPDMLSSRSWGLLVTGKSSILPPTAATVPYILDAYKVPMEKMHCVLVGWGNLVGKPLSLILARRVASMAIVRSKTPDIGRFTREADILVTGAGKASLIGADMLKDGVIAIDAGYSKMDGKVCGDIDFASVSPKAAIITPVPGGVGPLTVALLLKNIVMLASAAD